MVSRCLYFSTKHLSDKPGQPHLEILKKVQDVAEDVEMIARELARNIERPPTKQEDGDL